MCRETAKRLYYRAIAFGHSIASHGGEWGVWLDFGHRDMAVIHLEPIELAARQRI